MNARLFDEFAKSLARTANRRGLLKFILGLGLLTLFQIRWASPVLSRIEDEPLLCSPDVLGTATEFCSEKVATRTAGRIQQCKHLCNEDAESTACQTCLEDTLKWAQADLHACLNRACAELLAVANNSSSESRAVRAITTSNNATCDPVSLGDCWQKASRDLAKCSISRSLACFAGPKACAVALYSCIVAYLFDMAICSVDHGCGGVGLCQENGLCCSPGTFCGDTCGCPAGCYACINGECEFLCVSPKVCSGPNCVCPVGWTDCGETCCPEGQVCCSGSCVPACPPGQSLDSNCNCCLSSAIAVSRTSAKGMSVTGVAALVCCPEGQVACNDLCTDVKTNVAHCGACNSPCKSGQICENGSCTCPGISCPSGATQDPNDCQCKCPQPTVPGGTSEICGNGCCGNLWCIEGQCLPDERLGCGAPTCAPGYCAIPSGGSVICVLIG
jgi:hypothetical protein